MTKRNVLIASATLALAALIGLLALALVRTEGKPASVFINSVFGEVSIKEGPAPDFTLPLFNGDTLQLSQLQGKVVMVDFWSSWCPPCLEEAPVLAQVYREYAQQGVEFVGVDIWDSQKGALSYIDRYGITYPSGLDAKGVIAVNYGVRGIPEKYFVDETGRLLRKFSGPVTRQDLESILDNILAP